MDETEAQRQKRRGWWLRVARERAGYTVAAAAVAAGFSEKSGSTITMWESGGRGIKMEHLERLADFYGVPLEVFTRPKRTDEDRLDAMIQSASGAEQADFELEDLLGPGGDDGPNASPGRRSA